MNKFSSVRLGKIFGIVAILVLWGGLSVRAEDPVGVNKVFVVIHEHPKGWTRNPLQILRENVSTRDRSCSWFSLQPNCSQYPYQDQFCLRRAAPIFGLKAVFTF
jgi:hypothetical protein